MAPVSRDLCPLGSIFRGNKPLNSPVTYFMKIAALSTGKPDCGRLLVTRVIQFWHRCTVDYTLAKAPRYITNNGCLSAKYLPHWWAVSRIFAIQTTCQLWLRFGEQASKFRFLLQFMSANEILGSWLSWRTLQKLFISCTLISRLENSASQQGARLPTPPLYSPVSLSPLKLNSHANSWGLPSK